MDKQKFINLFAEKGYLLSPELIVSLESKGEDDVLKLINALEQEEDKPLVLTNSSLLLISKQEELKTEVKEDFVEEKKDFLIKKETEVKVEQTTNVEEKKEEESIIPSPKGIKVVYTFNEEIPKIVPSTFANYFRGRYNKLRDMLANRAELEGLTSMNKISAQKQEISVIGMIQDKRITKNGNFFFTVEDLTGELKVIVSSKNKELFERAEDLTYDEVVGIRGWGNNEFLFANEILQPDFVGKQKKEKGEGYALFISDVHIGSNKFMEKEFRNFIKWLNLETEGKNKEIAQKCKYLFIMGDLVDGVSVYPGQEPELAIKDLKDQYDHAAYLLSQIREDVNIIIIPGNHDCPREAQPQPVFDPIYADSLHKMKNALLLSNPSVVNIGATEKFEGYDILIYHGHSMNYYANNVKSLINKGYKDPKLLLSYLLKRRHLAPTHGSTPYVPLEQDPMIIQRVPDVIATGELHKLSVIYENNVALINCSCWQAKTPFQVKVGHEPDPCKVPALDLYENKIKILDFS